jgi:hypothetical protein
MIAIRVRLIARLSQWAESIRRRRYQRLHRFQHRHELTLLACTGFAEDAFKICAGGFGRHAALARGLRKR